MRYFFNMRGEDLFIEDPDGMELPDVAAVRREALLDARLFVVDKLKACEMIDARIIEVTDEAGDIVHSLPVMSVILSALPPGTLKEFDLPLDEADKAPEAIGRNRRL
jgi:hypothetical protein